MKNHIKISMAVLVLLMVALSVRAQGIFDQFAFPRVIVLEAPTLIGGVGTTTNLWVDTHGFQGIARIDITSAFVAGASNNVTIQTSPDQTNITTLANAAYAIPTTITYTNFGYGGTNLIGTNVYNLAGTLQTITAQTAGYAAPYGEVISPAPFTNTVSAYAYATNGVTSIGYNIGDASRYMRFIFTSVATTTNYVSATLTARKNGF